MRELFGKTDFWKEYEEKIKTQFAEKPLVHFVQDLHNYILHKGLPSTISRLSLGNFDSSMMLDIKRLRDWDRWSKLSIEYLETLDNEVRIEEFINAYAEIVTEFYEWFDEREQELNQEAYNKTEEICERVKEFVGPLPPDEIDLAIKEPTLAPESKTNSESAKGLEEVTFFPDPTGGQINNRIVTALFSLVDQYTTLSTEKKEQFLNAIMLVGWNLIVAYTYLGTYISIEDECVEALKDALPIELDPQAKVERDDDLYLQLNRAA